MKKITISKYSDKVLAKLNGRRIVIALDSYNSSKNNERTFIMCFKKVIIKREGVAYVSIGTTKYIVRSHSKYIIQMTKIGISEEALETLNPLGLMALNYLKHGKS